MRTEKEKRKLIIKHKQNGEKDKDIIKWLSVSQSTITRIWRLFKATGGVEGEPWRGGRKPLVDDETMRAVFARIEEQPDITENELIEEFSLGISQPALSKRLTKAGYTFKKRCSTPVRKIHSVLP